MFLNSNFIEFILNHFFMGGKKASKAKSGEKKARGGGFMIYLSEIRAKLKEEHPVWKPTEISKEGGKRWKALSEKEKQKYKDQGGKSKEKGK
jgi:hypothetical protein